MINFFFESDSSESPTKKAKTTMKNEKREKKNSKDLKTLDTFVKKEIKNESNSPEKSPKKRLKIEEVKKQRENIIKDDSFIDTSDEEKVKQELDTITSDKDNLKMKKVKKEEKYETDDHKYKKEFTRKRKVSGEKIEIGESSKSFQIIDENEPKFYSFHGNDVGIIFIIFYFSIVNLNVSIKN